ncbi:Hypothetical protein SMAX5B_005540 [Scophthalmus maximus]|uniref:Uncharacterized protein n=1 Tax=Scophthalmus maximus TaxID=52904 RepID=A0A2U9AW95_SCOMX|nr:Hypothetical protein SMAX5B_005540 [Scophthalmus maximus]
MRRVMWPAARPVPSLPSRVGLVGLEAVEVEQSVNTDRVEQTLAREAAGVCGCGKPEQLSVCRSNTSTASSQD